MTITARHPCRSPGCSALLEQGAGGYCPTHRRPAPSRKVYDDHRGSSADRGYDGRWQKFRPTWLAIWPVCAGMLMPAPAWSMELAIAFHRLRVEARARGDLLTLREPQSDLRRWLRDNPIYAWHAWDVGEGGSIIDHITPHKGDPLLFWAEWNLQTATKRAHDKKTARE